MAGKLPDRPWCLQHRFVQLQPDGTCVLCEGERLAEVDRNRGRKRAMRLNFKGGRHRHTKFNQFRRKKDAKFVPWNAPSAVSEERPGPTPAEQDEVLSVIRSMG